MLHKSKSVSIADLFRMAGTGRHIFDYPPEMWEAIAKAVPHPLKKFAVADGYFVEGPHAQALLDVISDATLEKPGVIAHLLRNGSCWNPSKPISSSAKNAA